MGHGCFPVPVPIGNTKVLRLRVPNHYRWRWRCVKPQSYPVQKSCYRLGCLIDGSNGQWTEPYTERQGLNSSKNVRLPTQSVVSLGETLIGRHGHDAVTRSHSRRLPDGRGSHDRGLQPSSVSTSVTAARSARTPKLLITVAAKSPLTTSTPCRHVTGSTSYTPSVQSITPGAPLRHGSSRDATASACSWQRSTG